MQTLTSDNQAATVFIPPAPYEIRANCNSDWACFIGGDTKGLSPMKAQEKGLILGSTASFVLVEINTTAPMTLGQYYKDEIFTQVWAIPTQGDILKGYKEGLSILTHFLLRSVSRDKLASLQQSISIEAFKKGNDPMAELMSVFDTTIFDATFQTDAGVNGQYAYVTFEPRQPKNDFERGVLEVGTLIRDYKQGGMNCLVNPRIQLAGEAPQDESVAALPAATTPVSTIPAVPQSNGKVLTPAK